MRNSDTALLERWISARDAEAFAQLVDRHAGMVLWTCRRVLGNVADAEETTQDCFLQVSQAQRTIAPSLGGWLHRVATNRALDRLRSDSARAAREKNYAADQPASEEPVWNDIQPHVDAIIAELPDELQTPLVLHFFEGQTHREVAKTLGLSRSAVTGRIQRAIGEIREQLVARNITLGVAALAALFVAFEAHAAAASVVSSLKKIGLAAGRPAVAPRHPWAARLAIATAAIAIVASTLWATGILDVSQHEASASGPASPASAPDPVESAVAEAVPSPASDEIVLAGAAAEESAAAQPPASEDKLRLRCVDEAGKPVEGAEVYYIRSDRTAPPLIQNNHPDDTKLVPFGPVLSDADGYVEVPKVDDAVGPFDRYYQVYARVPDKLVGVWGHAPKAAKNVGWDTITMVKSTRIGGVVQVPAGFDPAKVTVNLLTLSIKTSDIGFGAMFEISSKYRTPPWPELFSTAPARDGSFSLGDIPAGQSYFLAFATPGLGEAQRYGFNPNGDEQLAVEMLAEATISGTVRYATGGPAVDLPVFARPYGGGNSGIGVTTSFQGRADSLGRYVIKGLPGEIYTVFVQHYGEPPEWISPVVPLLETQPGMKCEAVDFVIERGALQEGVLRDKDTEQPIPNAWLIAMNPGDGENISRSEAIGASRTDSMGKFTFRLPTGVSFLYFFTVPDGYVYPDKQGRTFITVEAGEATVPPLSFHLAKKGEEEKAPAGEATIEGRVVDAEGQALAGVPIAIGHKYKQGEDEREEQSPSRPTDDDGHFSVKVQSTGEHQLVVGGGAFSRNPSDWFSVEADETKSFDNVLVERYEHLIVLTLTNLNDEPGAFPPIVSVRLRDTGEYIADGIVKQQGRIEFNVPDAPLMISGGQEGYKSFEVNVEPGSETTIALEREE